MKETTGAKTENHTVEIGNLPRMNQSKSTQRMTMSARMNTFLTIAPFVCALLVAAIHCHIDSPPMGSVEVWIPNWVAYGVAPAAVPIFLMISGFLFFLTADSMRQVAKKMLRRVRTVLLPFLAWSAAYYVAFNAGASLLGSENVHVDWSLLGILKGVIFYKYAYAMWFMFVLVGLVILSPVIYWILKSRIATVAVIGLASVMAVLQPLFHLNLEIVIDGESKVLFAWNCFLAYFCGCAASKIDYEAWIDRLTRISYPAVVAGLAVTGSLDTLIFGKLIPCFHEWIAVPGVTVLMVILLFKIAHDNQNANARIIPAVSTMSVYGIHPIVALITWQLLSRLPIPMLAVYFLRVILTLSISCAASVLIRKIKPLNFVLNGNRQ